MRTTTTRMLISSALIWTAAALLAMSTPTDAPAVQPCGNTDCLGAHYCSYMPGTQCALEASQCTVRDC